MSLQWKSVVSIWHSMIDKISVIRSDVSKPLPITLDKLYFIVTNLSKKYLLKKARKIRCSVYILYTYKIRLPFLKVSKHFLSLTNAFSLSCYNFMFPHCRHKFLQCSLEFFIKLGLCTILNALLLLWCMWILQRMIYQSHRARFDTRWNHWSLGITPGCEAPSF